MTAEIVPAGRESVLHSQYAEKDVDVRAEGQPVQGGDTDFCIPALRGARDFRTAGGIESSSHLLVVNAAKRNALNHGAETWKSEPLRWIQIER